MQVTPVYLAEIAPAHLRGAMNLMFQLSVTLGIFVAGLLNWKFSDMTHGWQLSLGLGGEYSPNHALWNHQFSLCLDLTLHSASFAFAPQHNIAFAYHCCTFLLL